MKEKSIIYFLFTIISVFPYILLGQSNNFSGHISNDTVWSNNVLVDGNVYVDNGYSLTINPGTTIEFQGYYKIEVNGSLQAKGTETDTITFTIADTTGYSNYSSTNGAWNGIRFWNLASGNDSSIFRYCKIQYSKAVDNNNSAGGAISYYPAQESKIKIFNCLLQSCVSKYQGGAIWLTDCSYVNILDNIIRNNKSLTYNGGGISLDECNSLVVRNNTIYNNSADIGAGISIYKDTHSFIVNNLIYNNHAITDGGGIHIEFYCSTKLINNTICDNSSYGQSGGINFNNHSSVVLKSNIIWGNTMLQCVIADDDSDPDFYNCDIQGGQAGFGGGGSGGNYSGVYQDNIDADPLFLNQSNHQFNLSVISSPCVDAGFPDTTGLHLPKKDLAGNTRVYLNWENSLIDIGAYEFQKNPKVVSITPEDGSTVDDASVDLTIEFDSPIAKQSGNVIIYNEDGSVFEMLQATATSINNQTVTISHNNLFINDHSYYINIDNTAFNDGYGNFYAGIEDDTTWNFSVITTDNFAGNALDFDGSNDYVEISDDNSLDLTNNYTIEAWIKPKSFDALNGIVSKYQSSGDDGYYLRLHPDSPYTGLNFDGMTTANGILVSNEWFHIAAVNDNGTRKLYLNGELQSLSGSPNSIQSNTSFLGIGVDYLQGGRYFHGEIDEVRLWNVVRSESDIRENINLTLSGQETGLVSYWQFNETTGSFAADIVGDNNGTLHLMTNDDWVGSGIAAGNGTSNTQIVSATGNIDFTGTGISMDFTQKSGSDTYVITRLETHPNINPEQYDDVFDNQFWIFRKYGIGTFQSNITYSLNEELYHNDETNPSFIQLYKRNSNSETDWQKFKYADSVNASTNYAVFDSIDGFSQFLITRYCDITPPYIADSYPKDNSYNAPIDSIQIFFNEVVNEVNGKSIFIYNDSGVLWNSYTIPSTQITGSGTRAITIDFGSELGAGNYFIHIDSAAFTDLSNNCFSGINNTSDWNFVISADGMVSIDTTWIDYTYINRDIYLNEGATLTVTPGTRVEFIGYYLLDIKGRLLAQGTENDSILFTTPSSSDHWNRLHFNNTPTSNDTSKINYCIMEHGHTNPGDGGAIYINNVDKLIINRNTFRHNYAYNDGGGIYVGHADPIIQNNIFHDNQTQMSGGGITLYYSNPVITGNLFHHNKTWNNGGAVYFSYSSPYFINNTVVYNFSSNWGGGLNFENSSNPIVENTIIYHNTRYQGQACNIDIEDCDPDFYYCDIGSGFNHNGWGGQNLYHINQDPLFTGNEEHPYSLQKISPCINLGNPGTTTDTIGELDIAGNTRILSGRVDIGAYEQGRISDGFAGTALEFAGTGDYVNLPNNGGFDFSSSFTVETWVNFGSMTEGEHTIIKNGDAWEIKTLTVPDLVIIEFGINDNDLFVSLETDSATIQNKWNHIACVFDPGNNSMTIYLNGIEGSTDFALPLSSTCDSITFGSDFIGKIDEFRIWNTARTIGELRSNMHLTLSDLTSGITTFLQFNEGTGTTVKDLATGYDGNLVNMVASNCWVNSTMPAGDGISNTQIIYSTGNQDFPGTGISMDFIEKMWTDTIVVTKIESQPNLNPYGLDAVFDNQYWIINKFGSGTLKTNISFIVEENLTWEDHVCSEQIRLFSRASNSDKNWNQLKSAISINESSGTATFGDLNDFSQFIIARKPIPDNFPGLTIDFDGIDDEVDFGNNESLDISNAMTVELWLKAEDVGHNTRILDKGDNNFLFWDYSFESISGKGIQLNIPGLNSGWWEFQYDMNYGQWYHVAWTLENNGNLTAYINGEIVRQENFAGSIIINTDDLILASPDGNNRYKGLLDEVRIWDLARTSKDIKENMYLVLAGIEQGLISYYQFNTGTVKSITDRAGGNDGTSHNLSSDAFTVSSVPFGGGESNTQIVSSTALVDFLSTDVTIDFIEKTGTDTIVVTQIDTVPNIAPEKLNTVFDKQYWAINKFGTGTFNSSISFVLQGDFISDDESQPQQIKLYTRGSCTDTNWVYLASASSIDALEHRVTFENIVGFGQFIIGRKYLPGNYPGKALSFDGVDDYVSISSDPSLDNNQFTVDFWTRSENPGSLKGIMDKGRDSNSDWYFLTGEPGETRGVIFGGGNGSSTIELMNAWNDNDWHHIAGTYNGTKMSLYVDGEKIGSASISIDITTNNISLGSRRDGTSFFNGTLDEVRIWDVALTQQELRENMNLTSYESQPGLVSYWQFNEQGGSVAIDYNKTNIGTMVNMDANSRILSTIATGSGFSNTQMETNGIVDFTGTGLSMDFSSQNGASVTVTRIDTVPNLNPEGDDDILDSQYWVVNRFSSGTINTNLTFTLKEDLNSYDAGNLGSVKLYTRESNSDESWTMIKIASNIDTTLNTVTFEGITEFSQFIITRKDRIDFDLTVFLEGPFNGTDMNTGMNPDDIPLAQPYNSAPWNYTGTETVASIPNTDIVDWVLIELRDATDAPSATSATMIAQQAAFILNDGQIVGLDGSSILSFDYSITHSMFVVIWHRNHLGIMSAHPVLKSEGVYNYNFTNPVGQAYGTNAQKYLDGIYGLFSSDANADGEIDETDKIFWETSAGKAGYFPEDFNLDGQVNNPDKNELWDPNEGKGSQVPE